MSACTCRDCRLADAAREQGRREAREEIAKGYRERATRLRTLAATSVYVGAKVSAELEAEMWEDEANFIDPGGCHNAQEPDCARCAHRILHRPQQGRQEERAAIVALLLADAGMLRSSGGPAGEIAAYALTCAAARCDAGKHWEVEAAPIEPGGRSQGDGQ